MALQNYRNENRSREEIPECDERDNATQLTINALKKTYCENLKKDENEIQTLKIGYESSEKIYKSKERRFLKTSENYHRYLNTEISMGSQLVQANEKLKLNVATYKTWDDALVKNLKDIFAAVKVAKAKMSDLRDAATRLENSKHDSCNTSQWNLVTGKIEKEKEKDEKQQYQPPSPPPIQTDACNDIEEVIELLFCMPRALLLDADSIFKASSDIIGIQKFCNIGSLVSLQQNLYTNADAFDKLLLQVIDLRKKDLDTRQDELKKALQTRTGFVMDLYNERNSYSSVHATLKKICCPKCNCVNGELGDCEPRLEDCERSVCEICGEVRIIFTHEEAPPAPPPAPTPAT